MRKPETRTLWRIIIVLLWIQQIVSMVGRALEGKWAYFFSDVILIPILVVLTILMRRDKVI